MTKLLFLIPLVFLISCTATRAPLPPVEIITRVVQPELYSPPSPYPVQLHGVEWHVITDKNLEEKIAELRPRQGGNWVLYGISTRDYENLAYNLQELRRFIRQQKEIIVYYQEATKPKGKDGWLEENAERTRALEDELAPTIIVEPEEEPNFLQRLWPF